MGLFDFMKRGAPSPIERSTAWIRGQIGERAASGDAVALVDACATMSGHGTLVFGMVLPAELPARDELRGVALAALQAQIAKVPDDQCDYVFGQIERAKLPVDITARRAALVSTRQAALERTTSWLHEQIAERAGTRDTIALVDACASLSGRGAMAFGMVVPSNLAARDQLRDECLAAIRGLIPTMSARETSYVAEIAIRANLPLQIAERRAELDAERQAERDEARAAAAGSEPRNPDLDREIAANPDDDQSYLVLADWLQARHHPRGELITLQLRTSVDPALDGAIAAHLEQHAASLLGPLAPHRITGDGSSREAFTWKRGFIHRAFLSVTDDHAASVEEILELLLAHPSGRYLAELAIGINGDPNDGPLADVIAILAREAPASLRSLHLGDFQSEECEMSWYQVGNLASLWAGVPQLRRLIVQGGEFELGTIDLPNLDHAEFRTGSLSSEAARAIAGARWPKLEYLDIWYGDPNYGGTCSIEDVRPLLARTDLTELVDLGLKNAAFTDEICRALVDAPLVAQLEELDLSMGTMSDDGAEILIAAVAAFPRLTRLDVSRNYLSEPAIARLRATFRRVVADDQDEADEDDRYPSVGE